MKKYLIAIVLFSSACSNGVLMPTPVSSNLVTKTTTNRFDVPTAPASPLVEATPTPTPTPEPEPAFPPLPLGPCGETPCAGPTPVPVPSDPSPTTPCGPNGCHDPQPTPAPVAGAPSACGLKPCW